MRNEKNLGIIAVLAAGCSWGATGVFVRFFDSLGYGPSTIVFTRVFLAFLIMIIALFLTKKLDLLKIRLKDLWCIAGAGISSGVLINIFFSMSTVMNTLALAAVLLATAPIFVVLLSKPIFGEPITKIKIISLIIAFIGCILVSGVVDSEAVFSPVGVFIGLLAGLGYATYSIMTRFALNRGYGSLTINAYSFGVSSLINFPFTNFALITATISVAPGQVLFILLLHTLFVALVPYMLFTYGMKFMDTGKASILSSVEPVAAAVFGFAFYREIPTVICTIGIILVLFALILLNYKKQNAPINS